MSALAMAAPLGRARQSAALCEGVSWSCYVICRRCYRVVVPCGQDTYQHGGRHPGRQVKSLKKEVADKMTDMEVKMTDMEVKMTGMEVKMAGMEVKMAGVKEEVASLKVDIEGI